MSENRDEWEFDYTAQEVADAAASKAKHHSTRADHWSMQREQALLKIKESGVDVRAYEVTGGQRHEVVIDPTLATRLGECEGKIKSHREQAERYEVFSSVLSKHPEQPLKLTVRDVRYFGLA